MASQNEFRKQVKVIYRYLVLTICGILLIGLGFVYLMIDPSLSILDDPEEDLITVTDVPDFKEDEIVDGVHLSTGFTDGEGLVQVIQNCTNCHSAALVTQNRMTREGWTATIRWMQETQNLWDLGESEEIIVNYLTTYYAPDEKGRRENLVDIEWYELKD
ncbi:MAG: monoheme cytochrome C [Bacteroidota bacterium]